MSSLTREQERAIAVAEGAYKLCYQLNAMDGHYASSRIRTPGISEDPLGPFGHAEQVGLKTLTLAFGKEFAEKIENRVWDSGETCVGDFVREELESMGLEALDEKLTEQED